MLLKVEINLLAAGVRFRFNGLLDLLNPVLAKGEEGTGEGEIEIFWILFDCLEFIFKAPLPISKNPAVRITKKTKTINSP